MTAGSLHYHRHYSFYPLISNSALTESLKYSEPLMLDGRVKPSALVSALKSSQPLYFSPISLNPQFKKLINVGKRFRNAVSYSTLSTLSVSVNRNSIFPFGS